LRRAATCIRDCSRLAVFGKYVNLNFTKFPHRVECGHFCWPLTMEDVMRRSVLAVGVVLVVIGVWSVGRLWGQEQSDKVVFTDANHAKFTEVPNTKGKVSMAHIWGDPDAGAHGTFTKFAPGYDAGMHTHTNDIWIMGIKGSYLYKDDAGEKRVGPGDFLRVPGGHKHWSGGDKKAGAVFYEESSGKFDLIPAK
jgi:quercetin dioxygenase-like cupin family protein